MQAQPRIGVLLAIGLGIGIFSLGDASAGGQEQKSMWSARELTGTLSERIKDVSGESHKAEKGTILEVTGSFSASDLKKASLDLSSVVLTATSVADGKKTSVKAKLLGICLFRKPENRLYHLPKQLGQGTLTEESDVGEFKWTREKEGAPLIFSLVKSPTQLCLAFEVPKDAKATYELRFGDLKAAVSIPASK